MTHAGRSVDHLRLDGCDRAPEHGHPAAAVHPLDRDRRDADPGRRGARLAHACCPRSSRCSATRINRLRVMPKRFVAPPSAESGFWAGWARLVTRRPLPIFLLGAVIVTLVIIPAFHINPSDAELSKEPSAGDARAGQLAVQRAGLPAGVFLPHVDPRRARRDACGAQARPPRTSPTRPGSTAQPLRRRGGRARRASSRRSARWTGTRARPGTPSRTCAHDVLPRRREPGRRRSSAHPRRRAGRDARLHPRRLRQVPVRPAVRARPDVRAPDARVPVGRARRSRPCS